MPHPDEPYYCSQQISIPSDFPDILKQFTKAAIRTQPKDVLQWSTAYFQAMSGGEVPPMKQRMDGPVATQKRDTGLTIELLKTMNRQLGKDKTMDKKPIEDKWLALCLQKESLDDLFRLGDFTDTVEWHKFLALACSLLADNIATALKIICEVLTSDPPGGPAKIPYKTWLELYRYLSTIDGSIPKNIIEDVQSYVMYYVEKQNGMIMPRNFLNPDCPKLFQ